MKKKTLEDGEIITEGIVVATAGAGTGKTTFLTKQFVEKVKFLLGKGYSLKDSVKSILAVTFTIKATNEMKERIADALSAPEVLPYFQIFTIDSFCKKILKKFSLSSGIASDFSMMSEGYENIFFSNIISNIRKKFPLGETTPDALNDKQIYKIVERFRYLNISPEEVLKMESQLGENFLVYLKTVYEVFVRELKKSAVLDFPQLLFEVARLLENKEIANSVRSEYKFVFIDEFQDTSPLQALIFKKISPEFLCVVGDFNQSIYAFRGAHPENIREIFETANYVKRLKTNRRSTKNILSFVNAFMPKVSQFHPLEPHSEAVEGDKVKIVLCEGRISEAEYIADRIEELRKKKKLKYGDFAIVLRSLKTPVSDFESVLRARGIPFITTAGGGFYERPEIKQILAFVKAIANPCDDVAFLSFLLSPMISFSPQEVYDISRSKGKCLFEKFHTARVEKVKREKVLFTLEKFGQVKSNSVYQEILNIVSKCGFPDWINANFSDTFRDRAFANLKKFLEKAAAYERDVPSPSLAGFVKYLSDMELQGIVESEASTNPGDCVEIFTIHKIKGLERRVVFVANVTKWQFPVSERKDLPWQITPSGIFEFPKRKKSEKAKIPDEEWRLFYVACTRAKENLFILGSFSKKWEISPMLEIFFDENLNLLPEFAEFAELENVESSTSPRVSPSRSLAPVFVNFKTFPVISEKSIVMGKLKNGFTVTEISHYDFCPRNYFFSEILKTPHSSSGDSAEVGNVFHQAIEFFDELHSGGNFRRRIFSALKNAPVEKSEIEKMISNFLSSRFTEKPFMKEAVFTLKLGGFYIKGAIDRIEKETYGFEIYDYKTGTKTRVSPYEFTMNVYALGCQEVFGLAPVKKLSLFFLRSGEIKDVKILPEKMTEERLKKVLSGIEKMDFRPVADKRKCSLCPYRKICEGL